MGSQKRTSVAIRATEVLDAIEELGILTRACEVMNFDRKQLWRMIDRDPAFAEQVKHAVERGRAKRKDWLETLAYSMAPDNPTMVMFLLKREDPSYRESYNVTTSTAPTDYIIDLSLPADGETQHTDPAPAEVLE
jgi:hypothetical protein